MLGNLFLGNNIASHTVNVHKKFNNCVHCNCSLPSEGGFAYPALDTCPAPSQTISARAVVTSDVIKFYLVFIGFPLETRGFSSILLVLYLKHHL